MDRTRIRRNFATDRISNLPRDVIDHIFTCLPLRDAVRTSILSRDWQYKWVTIPHLVFDGYFDKLDSVIYQILLYHKGPIVKFKLEAINFHNGPALVHWLHVLSNHPIEELELTFSSLDIDLHMPYRLFSFDNLRRLFLAGTYLKTSSAFKGFDKLIRLDLQDVYTTPEDFSMFISKCPMLEYLNFCSFSSTFEDLEIDAPNLKFFDFRGIFTSIRFKNASLLAEISISYAKSYAVRIEQLQRLHESEIFELNGNDSNFIKVFGQLPSVKRLKLNDGFLEFLARGGVPQKLPDNLDHLSILHLSIVYLDYVAELASALCLIRNSPNLQSLEITFMMADGDLKPATRFVRAQQKCEFSLGHLKIVKIHSFSGEEPEMEFVKLLLSVATVLRKLEIDSEYSGASEQGSDILIEFARFRRASSQAEIIFNH